MEEHNSFIILFKYLNSLYSYYLYYSFYFLIHLKPVNFQVEPLLFVHFQSHFLVSTFLDFLHYQDSTPDRFHLNPVKKVNHYLITNLS